MLDPDEVVVFIEGIDHLRSLSPVTQGSLRGWVVNAVGADTWVRPDDTTSLRNFQIVAAAAPALERLGRIEIMETHEGDEGDLRLIDGLRIRRLK